MIPPLKEKKKKKLVRENLKLKQRLVIEWWGRPKEGNGKRGGL